MAQFICKIGNRNIDPTQLADSPLKTSFEKMRSRLDREIGSFTCTRHKHGPLVTLNAERDEAVMAGFGSCCDELNDRVLSAMNRLGFDTGSWSHKTTVKHTTT